MHETVPSPTVKDLGMCFAHGDDDVVYRSYADDVGALRPSRVTSGPCRGFRLTSRTMAMRAALEGSSLQGLSSYPITHRGRTRLEPCSGGPAGGFQGFQAQGHDAALPAVEKDVRNRAGHNASSGMPRETCVCASSRRSKISGSLRGRGAAQEAFSA